MPCPGIVVIEDDFEIRDAVCEILSMEGYRVRGFSNGREALEGLRDCDKPCLILLDLMMPVMDGWQFLEERRHLEDTIVAVPVFIVSAVAEQARGDKRIRGYIKKPVDIDVLLNVVHKHCDEMSDELPKAA